MIEQEVALASIDHFWPAEWYAHRLAKTEVGQQVCTLMQCMRTTARSIALLAGGDADLERRIHLWLCRKFLKALAAHLEQILVGSL